MGVHLLTLWQIAHSALVTLSASTIVFTAFRQAKNKMLSLGCFFLFNSVEKLDSWERIFWFIGCFRRKPQERYFLTDWLIMNVLPVYQIEVENLKINMFAFSTFCFWERAGKSWLNAAVNWKMCARRSEVILVTLNFLANPSPSFQNIGLDLKLRACLPTFLLIWFTSFNYENVKQRNLLCRWSF